MRPIRKTKVIENVRAKRTLREKAFDNVNDVDWDAITREIIDDINNILFYGSEYMDTPNGNLICKYQEILGIESGDEDPLTSARISHKVEQLADLIVSTLQYEMTSWDDTDDDLV